MVAPKLDRPAVPPGVAYLGRGAPGRAAQTDSRVTSSGLLGILRPGAGDAVSPYAPGPRPPVAPNALLAIPINRSDSRRDAQLAQLARRPGDVHRPQLTAEQLAGERTVRRTIVGKARPLSYVYRFVGKVGIGGGAASSASEDAEPARDPLPCIDCG